MQPFNTSIKTVKFVFNSQFTRIIETMNLFLQIHRLQMSTLTCQIIILYNKNLDKVGSGSVEGSNVAHNNVLCDLEIDYPTELFYVKYRIYNKKKKS